MLLCVKVDVEFLRGLPQWFGTRGTLSVLSWLYFVHLPSCIVFNSNTRTCVPRFMLFSKISKKNIRRNK